ncbi:MAG: lipopolysaccharide kinase InaA family protein [Gemmataceae bacterium]
MSASERATDIRWHVEPKWRGALLADGRVPLDDWLQAAQAEKVKDGRFRTIYRVRCGGLDLHVKHCRPVGLRAWLREWLRPAKALLEFRRIRAIARRNIPTLEALAVGTGRGVGPSDSYLITESLADTQSLGAFLSLAPPPRVRQRLARELGRFLAQLHDAGIRHADLHPGNLLLRWPDDRPEFVLIDLHDVQTGRPLRPAQSLANLVLFNRWFVLRSSRSDRLRCWRAYCAARGLMDSNLGRRLEEQTWRSNRRFWRGRLTRCLRASRHFQRLSVPGLAGFAVRDIEASAFAPLLANPDAPFREPTRPLLKDSRSSTVAEIDLTIGGQPLRVIYKRFRVTSRWDGVASLFRRTACLRSWINGHSFRDSLLPTPRPLAFWHRQRRGVSWEGYLVVEKVESAEDFRTAAQCEPAALRIRIDELARRIRELHDRGWSHRDLKATNLLLAGEQFSFIDLVGARRTRASWERRRRDLARLNASFASQPQVTRADRLRFLRSYLNWGLHGQRDWKMWWRRVAALTEVKRQRNLRRGRPLT